MAIELAFSFIMGVTCLVFSVSLVRKLQEDDHPPRGYTGGRGNGGRGNGSGGISAGSANSQPSRRRDGTLGGGGGGLRVGVVRGKNDEDLRRSASPTGLGYGGRGIGSLLRRNAGSRVDLYEDSDDDDYAEAMTVGGGDRLDAGIIWCIVGSSFRLPHFFSGVGVLCAREREIHIWYWCVQRQSGANIAPNFPEVVLFT